MRLALASVLRFASAAFGLALVGAGVAFLLAPGVMAPLFALVPSGTTGYNSLRGDFGGLFVGSGVFVLTGALRRRTAWLHAAAFIIAVIIVGRTISLVIDGYSADGFRNLVGETLCMALLMATARSLGD